MAKKPEDRPESMWDLLKILRATKVFKKPPRIPEASIFDDLPTAGRVHNQEMVSEMVPQANKEQKSDTEGR